jgi:acyl carrier protein
MSAAIPVIKRIVARVKRDESLAAQLADDADLVDGARLDSLELLQFMLEVEESLGVAIDFDRLQFDDLHSIRRLAEFLDTMPARPPTPKTG